MKQQELDLLVAAAFPDHVVVVKHQNYGRPERGQLIGQKREHHSGDIRGLHPKGVKNLLPAEPGTRPLQRADHMPPQPAGVIVAKVKRDPGERPVLGCAGTPLRYNSGLSKARGSINEHEPGASTGQILGESRPLHPLHSRVRRMELCLDRHIQANARTRHRGNSAHTFRWPLPVPGASLSRHLPQPMRPPHFRPGARSVAGKARRGARDHAGRRRAGKALGTGGIP